MSHTPLHSSVTESHVKIAGLKPQSLIFHIDLVNKVKTILLGLWEMGSWLFQDFSAQGIKYVVLPSKETVCLKSRYVTLPVLSAL